MTNVCEIPVPKSKTGCWLEQHQRYVKKVRNSKADVVFIGDSIIEHLQTSSLWAKHKNNINLINLGIGGDRVEHVLWRLLNGELNFSNRIKAVVLFVGTNNIDCTPRQIFEGILKCITEIKNFLGPDVHIIQPTLLPKGQHPNVYRDKNVEVNNLLMERFSIGIKDNFTKNVHLIRIDENVLDDQGKLSSEIMYDFLHLTDSGYDKIFSKVFDFLYVILKLNRGTE